MFKYSARRNLKTHCNWLLATAFLFPSINLKAQLLETPNIEIISESDGLPFNIMSLLLKDKLGFLWIGSAEGLARYDGYSFLSIDSKKGENSLPNDIITSMTLDQSGYIWTGHLGGYVSRLDPVSLKIWHTKISEADELQVKAIFCSSENEIYCFVDHKGLYRFNEKTKTFLFISPLGNLPEKGLAPAISYNRASCFYEDGEKNIWIASGNGLYRFKSDSSTVQHISSLSEDKNKPASVNQILSDGHGGLWCSTYGSGMIHYDVKRNTFDSHLFQSGHPGTSNIIYGIENKNKSEIWVASSGLGLGFFNTATNKFTFFISESQLGSACTALLLDELGILWVTSDKGLMKWNTEESMFSFSKINVSKSDNQAYYGVEKVFMDEGSGRKLVGTSYADGLHVFDAGKEFILPYSFHPKGEPYQITQDIIRDRSGNILVLTRDYLYQLSRDNRLIKVEGINKLLASDQIPHFYRMIESENGDLWICSARHGLFHFFNKEKKWERLSAETPNTLAEDRIYGVLEDKQNRIWLLQSRAGITVYSPREGKYEYFKHSDQDSTSLISNLPSDITQTQEGEIWISTINGISIFDASTNSFHSLNTSTGLPSNIIVTILADNADNIWATTNKGLIRIEKVTHKVTLFNVNDGLRGVYSNFYLMEGAGDEMCIGVYQGFYHFNPFKIFGQRKREAPVFITAITNLSTPLSDFNSSGKIKIDYLSNSLSIEFAALNYLNQFKNKYHYKMDGLDKEWSETNNHLVTYSGIPSGSYTFRVQLVGNKLPLEATVNIEVATPFWKQIWFRLLLVLVGAGGVYMAYQVRLNQIRQEEKLKTEFNQKLADVEMKALKAQMSPHFIFNSLNSINRYIVKSEPEKASLYLTKFSKLIRLILDNSNNKTISLEQELNAIKLYIDLEALRFDNKFSYSVNVSDDLNPMAIAVPPMIIQPFVENAIWHGLLHKETRGHLDIQISRFAGGLQCIITDNGIGRKMAEELKSKSVNKEKSYGMKITKDRLTMLNGESKISAVEIIDLTDEAGHAQGTKVIIKIMAAELEPEF